MFFVLFSEGNRHFNRKRLEKPKTTWVLHNSQKARANPKTERHLFDHVTGIWCEVGWQIQLALENLVNCLLSVFCSERRLTNKYQNNINYLTKGAPEVNNLEL